MNTSVTTSNKLYLPFPAKNSSTQIHIIKDTHLLFEVMEWSFVSRYNISKCHLIQTYVYIMLSATADKLDRFCYFKTAILHYITVHT